MRQCAAERLPVRGRDKQAGAAIFDNFRHAGDIARNNRHPRSHRKNERQRKPFPKRGEHKHVNRVQQIADVAPHTEEMHPGRQTQRFRPIAQALTKIPVASNEQMHGLQGRCVRERVEQNRVALLLRQSADHPDHGLLGPEIERRANLGACPRRCQARPVDGVADHVDLLRIRMHLPDVGLANRLGHDHDARGAVHQQPLRQGVTATLAVVDVVFRADHNRHARQHRGKTAVQARRQQKGMDDVRLRLAQKPPNASDVPGTAQAWIETERRDWNACRSDLAPDGPKVVDGADHRLKSIGQVPYQVEHQILGAADFECLGDVHHTGAVGAHEAIGFRATANMWRCTSDSNGSIDSTTRSTAASTSRTRSSSA